MSLWKVRSKSRKGLGNVIPAQLSGYYLTDRDEIVFIGYMEPHLDELEDGEDPDDFNGLYFEAHRPTEFEYQDMGWTYGPGSTVADLEDYMGSKLSMKVPDRYSDELDRIVEDQDGLALAGIIGELTAIRDGGDPEKAAAKARTRFEKDSKKARSQPTVRAPNLGKHATVDMKSVTGRGIDYICPLCSAQNAVGELHGRVGWMYRTAKCHKCGAEIEYRESRPSIYWATDDGELFLDDMEAAGDYGYSSLGPNSSALWCGNDYEGVQIENGKVDCYIYDTNEWLDYRSWHQGQEGFDEALGAMMARFGAGSGTVGSKSKAPKKAPSKAKKAAAPKKTAAKGSNVKTVAGKAAKTTKKTAKKAAGKTAAKKGKC